MTDDVFWRIGRVRGNCSACAGKAKQNRMRRSVLAALEGFVDDWPIGRRVGCQVSLRGPSRNEGDSRGHLFHVFDISVAEEASEVVLLVWYSLVEESPDDENKGDGAEGVAQQKLRPYRPYHPPHVRRMPHKSVQSSVDKLVFLVAILSDVMGEVVFGSDHRRLAHDFSEENHG
eukprot:TRINITY_DN637_c0_g1_i1.p2 TRINITY_DN637_c0_g1~~TRINITY_DN637_c0_g1_i1.p2  ORF type:complete len:174 (-),score=19.66 TRINITY_DN637_c0_g1_i1:322-843(-)